MDKIAGRTAFITGGAQGIGLGIARAFAREGAKLALADIDVPALAAAERELSQRTRVKTFVLDVRDRDGYARAADETEAQLGPVSLLFNNAGVGGGVHVSEMTYAFWDWVLGINLTGVVNGVQTFVPRMLDRDNSHIVNTASGAGLVGGAGFLYDTSKFAVVGMSEALRVELEPYGIGVSVLCPGPVATQIIANASGTRPAGARPTSATPEAQTRVQLAEAFLAKGTPPDAVGEMVLDAVSSNRLYIYTDAIMAEPIKARMKALLDAIPSHPHPGDVFID